LGPIYNFNDVV